MQDQEIIKSQAQALVKALAEQGTKLPFQSALDMVSRMCHSKDWNALSAQLKNSAPGMRKHPLEAELERIEKLVYSAGTALDHASNRLEAGPGEPFAYEAQISSLQNEVLPRLRGMIRGEVCQPSQRPQLLLLPSGDGPDWDIHALVPAGLNIEEIKRQMQTWLDERRAADEASGGEDTYIDWDIEAKLAALGCIVLSEHVTGPRWD